jgi:hypothetical protein
MANGLTPTSTTKEDDTLSSKDLTTDEINHQQTKGNLNNSSLQQTDKTMTNEHQINTTTENDKTTHLLSSQPPRFSKSEIIKKFLHINHRYCHKIKISIPWDDQKNIPTSDTYYKSIHYFYQLVK